MNDDQEAIKRAAELLLKGASLLKTPCPKCKNPLLLINGKLFCTTCNLPVVRESEIKKKNIQNLDVIELKIKSLSMKLELSDDPDEIVKLAETIKNLQNL